MPRTELKPEFLGVASINSFISNVSSPRACMDANHFASHLPLFNPDEKLIKTGIEYELGKTVDDVRAEHDYVVKGKVERYAGYGLPSPGSTLFVEFMEDGKLCLDYVDIPGHKSSHGFFGYPIRKTEIIENISYNDVIPKGTVLGKTDSYGREGSYDFGLNANVVFMSHPSVADDGFVISESFAKRAAFPSIIKRVININKNTIPLNLNGNDDIFKFLPEIGENVRADGMLCATRPRNDWFSVYDLSNRGLVEVDSVFDDPVYVNTHSKVIDIKVIRGNYNKPEFPSKITEQLDRYADMLIQYYKSVITMYERIMAEKSGYASQENIRVTPRLTNFMTDCYVKVNAATTGKIKLSYKRLPIDQYRIEVTTMNTIIPNYGYKLTDLSASKGVACLILPDDQMPVDKYGNRADVISDAASTISRMNLARAYEAYMGATSRDNKMRLTMKLKELYGEDFLHTIPPEGLAYARDYLRGLYVLINSEMATFIDSLTPEEMHNHLKEVVTDNLYIYYPTDNERNVVDVIADIDNSIYKPLNDKVVYQDALGRKVETVDNFMMGVLYFMFLEKIGNTYSAVSSSKVNNFGFPVKGTNLDKVKYPHSLTPGKILAETENRIIASFTSMKAAADLMDLALNPNTHKTLYRKALESNVPFTNQFQISREDIPYGETKSLQIWRHIFAAAGIVIKST